MRSTATYLDPITISIPLPTPIARARSGQPFPHPVRPHGSGWGKGGLGELLGITDGAGRLPEGVDGRAGVIVLDAKGRPSAAFSTGRMAVGSMEDGGAMTVSGPDIGDRVEHLAM